MDPTGEIVNILVGGGLGGLLGGAGGFISSAVSQALSGEKIDWRKAGGAATRGFITGAVQGGLMASGAGFPLAFAANFLAGTTGSAAEQYISTGEVSVGESITAGLTNAVSNAIYGKGALKSAKQAFGKGLAVGSATSAINYISDLIWQRPADGRMNADLLSEIVGGAVLPYEMLRDPRRGCGSASPFAPSFGYSTARGYQYCIPQAEIQSQSQRKGFGLKDFAIQTVIGGLTGGFTSAAFYGAGKGIAKLRDCFSTNNAYSNPDNIYKKASL